MAESHDYIVIGSGPGGAPVANRLSADSSISVCVIEAGGENAGPTVRIPMLLAINLPRKNKTNWAFETIPQKGLKGRKGYQPRGKGMGGSTAINAQIYMRGHRDDYNEWRDLGCPGWGYDDVLPIFKRSENNTAIDDAYHGQGGEMNVEEIRSDNPWHLLLNGMLTDAQFTHNPDLNGAHQEGFDVTKVMQKEGERCSAAKAFLLPVRDRRENLTIHLDTQAVRLIVEGKRVVGVEVVHKGDRRIIRANKEVILAAGAFQTPQLLQLSGIGRAEDLREHGIDVIHDLPMVGYNLQDHLDFILGYHIDDRKNLLGITFRAAHNLLKSWRRYQKERRGMFTSNYAEICGFLRLSPDSPRPEIQYEFVMVIAIDHARKLVKRHGLSCHILGLRPKSRGWVKLRSADYRDAPLINPNFLDHPDDIRTLVEGTKRVHNVIRNSNRVSAQIKEDLFTAHCKTDEDWEDIIRERADTNYHPVGTCRMGTDDDAVVDARTLKVNGIEGLRISDASVMPRVTGGNTTVPTMLISEKCADFILSERTLP